MSDKPTLAEEIAELILDVAREWLSRAELEDGTEVRAVWTGPDTVAVEHRETGHTAEFLITVTAEQLPPPGPEDDGALRAELAAEVEYRPGTWRGVRTGDMVRIRGVEARAATVLPLKWLASGAKEVRVTLDRDGQEKSYGFPPSGQVEIGRTAEEWSALDILSRVFPGTDKP